MAALKGLIKRGIKKLKSYKCTDCGSYHLSSFSDYRKPHGYRGKKRKVCIKKKPKVKFNKIKVTKEEIEKGRQKQLKQSGIFDKIKNTKL